MADDEGNKMKAGTTNMNYAHDSCESCLVQFGEDNLFPYLLPCLHNVCKGCLFGLTPKLEHNHNVKCPQPQCGIVYNREFALKNVAVLNLTKALKESKAQCDILQDGEENNIKANKEFETDGDEKALKNSNFE